MPGLRRWPAAASAGQSATTRSRSPIAAGVFAPAFDLVLRPEIAALSMSGSSFIVAVDSLALKGLRLRRRPRPSLRSVPPANPWARRRELVAIRRPLGSVRRRRHPPSCATRVTRASAEGHRGVGAPSRYCAIGLLGENGSGTSTLLHVAGLLAGHLVETMPSYLEAHGSAEGTAREPDAAGQVVGSLRLRTRPRLTVDCHSVRPVCDRRVTLGATSVVDHRTSWPLHGFGTAHQGGS